jgi:FKBP-type peptidyl-prolyl cis-trans isomerase FkpA
MTMPGNILLWALFGLVLSVNMGSNNAFAAQQSEAKEVQQMNIETIQAGAGQAIQAGQIAVVHYTGWLYDPAAEQNRGEKFDSSRDRGQPFSFQLGAGRVIRGWDEGVAGMLVGERRILIIPANMGYGARGAGRVIPPNATLVFDVELIEIR